MQETRLKIIELQQEIDQLKSPLKKRKDHKKLTKVKTITSIHATPEIKIQGEEAEPHQKAELSETLASVKTVFKVHFEPTSKRAGKFELNEKLNELISLGDGVNFTLFNTMASEQPAELFDEAVGDDLTSSSKLTKPLASVKSSAKRS
jgi:hypothetical protein